MLELAKYITATVPITPAQRSRIMIIARQDFMKVNVMMNIDTSS